MSTAVAQAIDEEPTASEVDLTTMNLMHAGFRRDITRFARSVELTPCGDGDAWKLMASRWRVFNTVLHKHHHSEDSGLWPMLSQRTHSPEHADTLRAMVHQHLEIDPALERCGELFEEMASDANEGSRLALSLAVGQLEDALMAHLDKEESEAFLLIGQYLSGDDWNRLEHEHFLPEYSQLQRLTLLGWLGEGLSDEELLALPGMSRIMLALARRQVRRFVKLEKRTFRRLLDPGALAPKDRRMLKILHALAVVHRTLARISRGRLVRTFRGQDLVFLTVFGRRTSKAYTAPLLALRDGDSYIVASSSAGVDRQPTWMLNLQANPNGFLEHAGKRFAVVAEELEGAERELWWDRLVDALGDYDVYQSKVTRRVGVLRLRPAD